MDLTQIIVTLSGLALIGLNLWFFFGKADKMKGASKGALYACPMHPWITSNDPTADCSICGMKLVNSEKA
ncbi:MAG TPA: hypothetical protein DCZ75_01350 [Geobacter sp.]|nr:hypothetical protein [Geobacter sp.]